MERRTLKRPSIFKNYLTVSNYTFPSTLPTESYDEFEKFPFLSLKGPYRFLKGTERVLKISHVVLLDYIFPCSPHTTPYDEV